jgi:hypothetical protein
VRGTSIGGNTIDASAAAISGAETAVATPLIDFSGYAYVGYRLVPHKWRNGRQGTRLDTR